MCVYGTKYTRYISGSVKSINVDSMDYVCEIVLFY